MKHILGALILMILLFLVADHYQYAPNLMPVISIFFLIALLYFIAAIIGVFRRRTIAGKQTDSPIKNKRNNAGCSLLLFVLLIAILFYYYRTTLGSYSFQAMLFLDNLVKLSASASPLLFWGMLGLLVGAIYGSIVAWRKYKLHGAVNLIPIGIFILLVAILYNVNHPLEASAFGIANNLQTVYAYDLVTATEYKSVQDENAKYKPSFLLDNNDKTAWITEAYGGIYEEFRFSFGNLQEYRDKQLQCVGFAIKNGYRKSEQLWSEFARAKSLAIKYNGRFVTNAIVKDDGNGNEEIKINPIPIGSFDNLSISISDVYPGDKYPDRVAISELVPIVEYVKVVVNG